MAINSNFDVKGKNHTPQQVSFIAAITSAFFYTIIIVGLDFFGFLKISARGIGLLVLFAVAIDYVANYYFVRYHIFRRIKLIYKVIHRHKIKPNFKVDKIEMEANVIDDVEGEVDKWAADREEEIEEQERMAAYRRQYIGDISHELKTPIFSIQGFIHTLLDGGIDDPKINRTYLERAAKNVERLQAIVEDLETITRLEQGDQMLDLREFDIRALCEEVFSDLETRAKERKTRLSFKDGADQHFRVRADRERIRQVLTNLVHNSIKYGKESGSTKVGFYDLENYLLVEVSDNGIGIGEEHLNHVFDRFYRVDKSRSRDVGGTGLGLAIVKHIVEAHGQTINVRSTAGQGSTFGFTMEKA